MSPFMCNFPGIHVSSCRHLSEGWPSGTTRMRTILRQGAAGLEPWHNVNAGARSVRGTRSVHSEELTGAGNC